MSKLNTLAADSISAETGLSNLDVHLFQSLPSTNSWLLDNPCAPGRGRLCVVEEQTEGRGRRGNSWHATKGRNITMSLGWCYAAWPKAITGLSLAVGMVVAERLNDLFELDVKVKWPNDLMVNDRKLGGILIELAGQQGGTCQVVVGLGLNLDQAVTSPAHFEYDWIDLKSLGIEVDRNTLIGGITRDTIEALTAFEQHGFERLIPAWPNFSNYEGREIRVGEGSNQVIGRMAGVDKHGALLLIDEEGQTHRLDDSATRVRLVR